MPMDLRLKGDISGIPALLTQCHLSAERLPDVPCYVCFLPLVFAVTQTQFNIFRQSVMCHI